MNLKSRSEHDKTDLMLQLIETGLGPTPMPPVLYQLIVKEDSTKTYVLKGMPSKSTHSRTIWPSKAIDLDVATGK